LHYPQTEMIAKYGEKLLTLVWKFHLPTEQKFDSYAYCELMAKHFVNQLINGTTNRFVLCHVHKHAVSALFIEASAHMAIISGKYAWPPLPRRTFGDTPESAQRERRDKHLATAGRNLYALTPRFAPTSSHEQLTLLGELAQQYPSVFIQTHLSENQKEADH
jgi:guanine deaminase